ncbi:hypothetical protein [Actinopolyspora mortivallis]|uniref:hypothetical protein n=1 Tax=Actinopolyspora mortivallis TaxID=33906 RepID=UPI0012ECD0D0|nr:hypothetical protein [Actinopolyspora mortivallis]
MTSPQNPWQQEPSHQPDPWQQGYSQQGGQPSPYAAPPVDTGATLAMRRPITVTIAFWIAVLAPIVVTLLMGATMLSMSEFVGQTVDAALTEQDIPENMTREEFRSAMMAGMMILFGFFFFLFAALTTLWIVFGFKMRAGRNWARITLTVFAAVWLVFTLPNLFGNGMTSVNSTQTVNGQTVHIDEVPTVLTALNISIGAVSVVSTIAFLVLVWLRPSNWFFSAAKRG